MHWVILANSEQQEELADKFSPAAQVNWISEPELFINYDADAFIDLTFDNSHRRKQLLQQLKGCLIVNSVAFTTADMKLNCIRVNGWPGNLRSEVWEIAGARNSLTEELQKDLAVTLKWVDDVPGFVSARIIAMVINEAYMTNEEKISSRNDIDIAMKTGTNYPYGPFEWARAIGTNNIMQLLERLSIEDVRYRPALSLKNELR